MWVVDVQLNGLKEVLHVASLCCAAIDQVLVFSVDNNLFIK